MNEDLIGALTRAVEAAPTDLALRLHLAQLLLERGAGQEAVEHLAAVLATRPDHPEAARLMAEALGGASPIPVPQREFDWSAAEQELDGVVEPMFVDGSSNAVPTDVVDLERPGLTLADVGGMEQVKERLTASFLAPLRNEELRRLYGKRLRGGLLMYGPPGCGKTFIARALAGELGAKFLPIALTDVLNPYFGQSETNVHELFQIARREAPCVIFLDEVDALGQRRASGPGNGLMRGVVAQLLEELDGIAAEQNDGVFVLAATNQPWEVDPALRRPGRLDRTVLVLPPDEPARAAIFRTHLADRPVEGVDLALLARRSDGMSGADIAYVCEVATERALLDSVRTGSARMVGMPDLLGALREVKPSIGDWLSSARNVVLFGNDDGTFDDLRAYLKKANRL
jgi:SpoVK/Ycf46/Vps4 family AAA+-type ATPase